MPKPVQWLQASSSSCWGEPRNRLLHPAQEKPPLLLGEGGAWGVQASYHRPKGSLFGLLLEWDPPQAGPLTGRKGEEAWKDYKTPSSFLLGNGDVVARTGGGEGQRGLFPQGGGSPEGTRGGAGRLQLHLKGEEPKFGVFPKETEGGGRRERSKVGPPLSEEAGAKGERAGRRDQGQARRSRRTKPSDWLYPSPRAGPSLSLFFPRRHRSSLRQAGQGRHSGPAPLGRPPARGRRGTAHAPGKGGKRAGLKGAGL